MRIDLLLHCVAQGGEYTKFVGGAITVVPLGKEPGCLVHDSFAALGPLIFCQAGATGHQVSLTAKPFFSHFRRSEPKAGSI
jgi:prolyl-tRNA editing enzyme YbaK/EbsC (Cys-tRNA(Pro) deacylase)